MSNNNTTTSSILSETSDLEQATALCLQYAASVHDSEDFVSGKTTPAMAALEFIAANPRSYR
jgi:hypothetical protein